MYVDTRGSSGGPPFSTASASRRWRATPIRAATLSKPCTGTARRIAGHSDRRQGRMRDRGGRGAVKWDSAEAEALVGALKGG